MKTLIKKIKDSDFYPGKMNWIDAILTSALIVSGICGLIALWNWLQT